MKLRVRLRVNGTLASFLFLVIVLNLGQARLHSSSWDWKKHKYYNPDTDSRRRTTCGSCQGFRGPAE